MPSLVTVLLLLGCQTLPGTLAWSGNCPHDVREYREPREEKENYKYGPEPVEFDLLTLGRTVRIGTLYDARTNMFFPEATLWDLETVKANEVLSNINYDESSSHIAQSTRQKLEFMGIKAELELELMGGAIQVSGSADYLSNEVQACSEVNVAFQYNHQAYEKHINVYTNATYGEECENLQYTHVVTRVIYGLNAFFVFKMNTQIDEKVEQVQGKLDKIIADMGVFVVEGGGSADLDDEQRAMLNETYIRVYGDFSPEIPLPTTFDEAISFIQNISIHFADQDQNSPLQVKLTPLHGESALCDQAQQIVNEINSENRRDLNNMLNDLEVIDMEIGTMINSDAATRFMPLRQNLQYFRSKLQEYIFKKKKDVQTLLPKLKENAPDADKLLNEILDEYKASPFHETICMQFLYCRNREVRSLQLISDPEYFEVRSNIEMADYVNANDVEYIFEKDKLVVLDLNILTDKSIVDNYLNTSTIVENDYWYMDQDKVFIIARNVRNIKEFALRNVDMEDRGYLLKISAYNEKTTETNALVKGEEVYQDFDPPTKISKPSVEYRSLSYNSFSFKVNKEPFTIGCLVSIHGVDNSLTYDIDKEFLFPPDTPDETEVTVTIDEMEAAHVYNITYDYITLVGNTVRSESSEKFNLPGTSSPRGVIATATESQLHISWLKPEFIVDRSLNEDRITYIVRVSDGATNMTQETDQTTIDVEGLVDATQYNVEVVAKLPLGIPHEVSESKPSSFIIRTSPKSPTLSNEYQVDLHTAALSWVPPEHLGSFFSHYILTWTGAGDDSERHLTATEPNATVTDLAMGEEYSFQVKVVTEEGESVFSEALSLRTDYLNQFGNLTDEVNGLINEALRELINEVHFCAANSNTNKQGTLTYTSFVTEINEVESTENSEWFGEDGVFHAKLGGVFRVRVGLGWQNGVAHTISIAENSKVTEIMKSPKHSDVWSEYASWESLVSLEADDTLSISHASNNDYSLTNVIFCVSSENWKIDE